MPISQMQTIQSLFPVSLLSIEEMQLIGVAVLNRMWLHQHVKPKYSQLKIERAITRLTCIGTNAGGDER